MSTIKLFKQLKTWVIFSLAGRQILRLQLRRLIVLGVLGISAMALSACFGNDNNTATTNNNNFTVNMDTSTGGINNNATDVSLLPKIVVKFSAPIIPTTLNIKTISLVGANQPATNMIINIMPVGTTNTVFAIKVTPLNTLTKYQLQFSSQIITAQNQQNLAPTTFNFITTGDPGVFNATLVSPDPTNAARLPFIAILFSKPALNVFGNITLTDSLNQTKAISHIFFTPDNSYNFRPERPLDENSQYCVNLESGIQSTDGQALSGATQFCFMTQSGAVTPVAKMVQPALTQVPLNPDIEIIFNESVTNVAGNFLLQDSHNNNVPLTFISSLNDQDYTYRPTESLNYNNQYNVILESAIKDQSGTPIQRTTFSFTTMSNSDFVVTAISPQPNTNISVSALFQITFNNPVASGCDQQNVVLINTDSGESVQSNVISVQGSDNICRLIPNWGQRSLYPYTHYSLQLNTIVDNQGNILTPINYNYFTIDTTALKLSPSGQNLNWVQGPSFIINLDFNKAAFGLNTDSVHIKRNTDGTTLPIISIESNTTNTIFYVKPDSSQINDVESFTLTIESQKIGDLSCESKPTESSCQFHLTGQNTISFTTGGRIIYATTALYDGNLGGQIGADALCNESTEKIVQLYGANFHAFSYYTSFKPNTTYYSGESGIPNKIVTADANGNIAPPFANPISSMTGFAWMYAEQDAMFNPQTIYCNGWSNNQEGTDPNNIGGISKINSTGADWFMLNQPGMTCNNKNHLYCVESW